MDTAILHGYAALASADWYDSFAARLPHSRHEDFATYTYALTLEGSREEADFRESTANFMKAKGDTVCVLVNEKPFAIDGVARWRTYSKKGFKGGIRKILGTYPYLYAPDFFVAQKERVDPVQVSKSLLDAMFEASKLEFRSLPVVVDVFEHNKEHAGQLQSIGFKRHAPQNWPTPPNLYDILGPKTAVVQYKLPKK